MDTKKRTDFPSGIFRRIRSWILFLQGKRAQTKVGRRCVHRFLSVFLKIHAVNLLEFTVHVSKAAFTFGGRKYLFLDMSGFAVIVYNASL